MWQHQIVQKLLCETYVDTVVKERSAQEGSHKLLMYPPPRRPTHYPLAP